MHFQLKFNQETKKNKLWFYGLGLNVQYYIYVCIITRMNRNTYICIYTYTYTEVQFEYGCFNAISMSQNIRPVVTRNSDLAS